MNYYLTFLTYTLFIPFMKTIKKASLRNIGFIHTVLLRAGVTEIELIIPNRISSYYGIGDLFQTFANNAVENGQVPMNEPIVIAHSQQGSIHTVAVPWEKGLSYIGHKTSMDTIIFNRG